MGNSHCTYCIIMRYPTDIYLLLWRGCLIGVEFPLFVRGITIFHETSRETFHGISAIIPVGYPVGYFMGYQPLPSPVGHPILYAILAMEFTVECLMGPWDIPGIYAISMVYLVGYALLSYKEGYKRIPGISISRRHGKCPMSQRDIPIVHGMPHRKSRGVIHTPWNCQTTLYLVIVMGNPMEY